MEVWHDLSKGSQEDPWTREEVDEFLSEMAAEDFDPDPE